MGGRLQLRRYLPEDHDVVVELHQLALRDTGAFADRGAWDADLDEIEATYLEDGEFLVGLLEGRLVAMGALKRLTPDRAEIMRMRVHPDDQRHGIGEALLHSLEEAAARFGVLTLVLDTTSVQVAALAFYAKNGYRETGRRRQGPFEIVAFEKRLGE
jgi:ribosomal protein S18 acetylase RimI-like enzyme